jgi:hypothetical protein
MTKLSSKLAATISVLVMMSGAAKAGAQPRGERITVTGEAVDMWCYLEGGDRGAAKKACATACAKAGNAIGIIDAKGNLYLAAGLKDHQPAQALLADRMNEQVTVTGTLVRKDGAQMIYIESVR